MTAASALSLTVGCASLLGGNKAREASRAVPQSFGALATAVGPSVAVQRQWDQFFADPDLRELIEEALKNNQQLNIQLQEIIITQNTVAGMRGQYIPRLDASAGGGIEKVATYASQGASDAAHGVPNPLPDLNFGFVASWETDISSRLRNARKAASSRYEATIQERNFLLTEIVAEIAIVLRPRRARQSDRDPRANRRAPEGRARGRQAEEGGRARHRTRGCEVLGRGAQEPGPALQPRAAADRRRESHQLPGRALPATRQAQRPALHVRQRRRRGHRPALELLENRPDVKAAELRLDATKFDTKSAKAAFYPSLRLDADVGFKSFKPSHLIDTPQSLVANLAGNLMAPLLNRAAIKADYRSANARQIQAVFEYERSILQAFTDVYNQMTAISNLRQRLRAAVPAGGGAPCGHRGVEGALSVGAGGLLRSPHDDPRLAGGRDGARRGEEAAAAGRRCDLPGAGRRVAARPVRRRCEGAHVVMGGWRRFRRPCIRVEPASWGHTIGGTAGRGSGRGRRGTCRRAGSSRWIAGRRRWKRRRR
ncbi:MAG: TolC family protein [Nannocystis sp.]|nr:TolC family protein [Nannocystis sp.]